MSSFMVVSGARTALRFALPQMGVLRIGAGPECDVSAPEEGVATIHAEVFLGEKPAVRALASDVGILDANGESERAVPSGSTVEVAPEERIRVGPLEVALTEGLQITEGLRLWDRAELEARVAAAGDSGGVVVRVRGGPELARQTRARLRPVDILSTVGPDELGVFLPGAGTADARVLLGGLQFSALGIAEVGSDGAEAAIEAAQPDPTGRGPASERIPSEDPAMGAVEQLLSQAAASDEPALILGETGTGKERLVEDLHRQSGRGRCPLVRVSAVEVGEEGLPRESLSRAKGGTLLIDEVSALSPRAQLALTQALEQGAASGLRVVATSNQDLDRLVREGDFRKDLFFRLAHFRIEIPPLRERPADIRAFCLAFLAAQGIHEPPSMAAMDALQNYAWPGNVRELESTVARAAIASGGKPLQLEHLRGELVDRRGPPSTTPFAGGASEDLDATTEVFGDTPMSLREEIAALERRRILEALEQHPTQTEAAKALGIPLRTFLNRMDALGIPRARKK